MSKEQLIERQMLLWQARRRAERERPVAEEGPRFRYITIGRGDGTLGDEIARELANRLGWHVFDKEIVNYIAENSHVRESLVRQLDERSQGLITDTILRLLRMPEWASFGSDEYHEALLKTLAYISAQGAAVLVGRGANFALRSEGAGLHIRAVASEEVRLQRLSQSWHVSPELARRCMVAGDEGRRDYVRHYFKQDVDDVRFYDIVFNTDFLTAENVADSVLGMLNGHGMMAASIPGAKAVGG